MENKALKSALLVFIMVLGIATAMAGLFAGHDIAPVFDAKAETNAPTSAGWTYHGVDVYAPASDWQIDDDDYVWYEDTIFDMGAYSFIMAGGDFTAVNCSFWFTSTADLVDGMYFYTGNATFINCNFYSKAYVNTSVDNYAWSLSIPVYEDEVKESVNVTFFECFMNSSIYDGFATPASESNIDIRRGNVTMYYCDLEMPETYLAIPDHPSDDDHTGDGNESGNFTLVNCGWIGNRTVADGNITYITSHFVTVHGVDTRLINNGAVTELTMFVRDAGSTATEFEPTNQSTPTAATYHLNTSLFYHPDLNCFWFMLVNATEGTGGVTNATAREYPFTMYIERPATWTDTSLYTVMEYSTDNGVEEKFTQDFNETTGTFVLGEDEEDNASATIQAPTVGTTYFSFLLDAPVTVGGVTDDWLDWDSRRTVPNTGSLGVDYVTLVANAGADSAHTAGALVTLDGSGSTGENTISNYTWSIYLPNGTLLTTRYGVTSTWDTTGRSAGAYSVVLLVTDDEGATDDDTRVVTLSASSSGSTSADGDDGFYDWSEDWYKFWTKSFWVDGVWKDGLRRFHRWVRDDLLWGPSNWLLIVIYAAVVLFILELMGDVQFYTWSARWIKKNILKKGGSGRRGRPRGSGRKKRA